MPGAEETPTFTVANLLRELDAPVGVSTTTGSTARAYDTLSEGWKPVARRLKRHFCFSRKAEAGGYSRSPAVLAFLHLTASGRETGIPTPADTTNLYDVVDGKISRIRIFLDRQEALEAAGLRE